MHKWGIYNTRSSYCKLILKLSFSAISLPWHALHCVNRIQSYCIWWMCLYLRSATHCIHQLTVAGCYFYWPLMSVKCYPRMLLLKNTYASVCRKCRWVADTLSHFENKIHPVDSFCVCVCVCVRWGLRRIIRVCCCIFFLFGASLALAW